MKLVPSRLGCALAFLLVASTPACGGGAAGGGESDGGGSIGTGGAGGSNDAGGSIESGLSVPANRAGGHDGDASLSDTAPGGKVPLPECKSDLPTVPFFLSADDSNSMASPVIAREHLLAGEAPPPAQIRTYEFLNYYNVLYDLADPQSDDLGIFVEMEDLGPSPRTGLPSYGLQIGVQAFQVPRVPLVVTFVVDSSGSLVGPGFERERAAILAITHQLGEGDIVNIVKWANDQNVLLENYVATGTEADDSALAAAVDQLVPEGGSDLHGGLVKGYELANLHFDPAKLNRVVLISDGGANIGVLDRTIIEDAAKEADGEGIYLVGIGVGPAKGYSDTLMDLVTDSGRGAYIYLDSAAEADSVFLDRFDEIMNVAARAVRVELEVPEYIQIEKFYGEEYSPDPAAIEPQNLAPGDSMVFHQVVDLTNPGAACGLDTVTVRVEWEAPITHEPRAVKAPATTLLDLLKVPPSIQMIKAKAIIAYAEALKTNDADVLHVALGQVQAAAMATGDADLGKIAELLQKHPKLATGAPGP